MNSSLIVVSFFMVFVFFSRHRICCAFISDTKLGKFIQNSTNEGGTAIDTTLYRKLNRDAIISAFKGFLEIVDDPMFIRRSATNYDIPDIVRSEGFVEKLTIRNLKNATLDDVYVPEDESFVQLKLDFPLLSMSGWYNMTCHVDRHNMSIYGNGSFLIELHRFQVALNVTLQKTKQGYTVLDKIDWNQTLGGVNVTINNLLGDQEISAIFSENLSVIIPALHDLYKPVINKFMGEAVMLYGKMLFINSKAANLETILRSFAKQQAPSHIPLHQQ